VTRFTEWRRISLLTACVVLATACVAPKVVEYKSFHERKFSVRSKPAEIQKKSTAELLDGGYLLIGISICAAYSNVLRRPHLCQAFERSAIADDLRGGSRETRW